MREYGKIAPSFWTGETGRMMRGNQKAQVVAHYLLTGPMANMIGLYHMPLALLADHTGIPIEGASKALRWVCEIGFCRWDGFEGGLEHVFVPEMASYQIGEPLSHEDKRVKGIISLWQSYRKSRYYLDFHARYATSFHLPEPSPIQAPSKAHQSQEKDQEQEQDQEAGSGVGRVRGNEPPSLEEVVAFTRERNSPIDPEHFHAHYTANGWVQSNGRKIKDWKAAVVTWEKNERKHGGLFTKPVKPNLDDEILRNGEEFIRLTSGEEAA